jgi:hypothetical protein
MPLRLFKSFLLVGLLLFLVEDVLATSCYVPLEQEFAQSIRAGTNLLYKGFYLGLILSAFLGNLILSLITTKHWSGPVALSVAGLPVALSFALWEERDSVCGYGGIEANNYLFVLVPLVILLLGQKILAFRSVRHLKNELA